MFVTGDRQRAVRRVSLATTKADRAYLATRRRAGNNIDPYGAGAFGLAGLGSVGGAAKSVLSSVVGGVKGDLDELRMALTVSTAASVAAAIAGVLVLVRTGRRR